MSSKLVNVATSNPMNPEILFKMLQMKIEIITLPVQIAETDFIVYDHMP